MDLISKQKAIEAIRELQGQFTCAFPKDWKDGMNEGFDHSVGVIELMDTVEAIPVSYVEQLIEYSKETGCSMYAVVLEEFINDWRKENE